MAEVLSEPPVFIVGAGRSGTTLLRSLLSAHARMTVTPETHYMKRVADALRKGASAPGDFQAFWDDLVRWSRFRDLGVDPARVLAIVDAARARDYRAVFAAMLRAYGEAQGKPRVGEKTPSHVRFLGELFAWFPDARVIAIRRDPRAVVASHLTSPWVSTELSADARRLPSLRRLRAFHVAERATFWHEAYMVHLARAQPDPRIYELSYEALVARPERETRALCDFLGEDFEDAMLSGDARSAHGGAPADRPGAWRDWAKEHQRRASAPVSSDSLEKWRDGLTSAEVATVEAICAEGMARFGYAPTASSGTGGGRRMLAKAALRTERMEGALRQAVRRVAQRP